MPQVPSLEHNNEVRGESLDLMKFIDSHFEGPSLFPSDPAKQDFAGVLFSYADSFHKAVTSSFKEDGINAETGMSGAAFDYIEDALSKFNDGPFFLGQFGLELNKLESYKQTKPDPKLLVESYKKRYLTKQ
ncbi:Glutathione S-transferase L2 chloroplastic [Bienertia sinuspersici]